MQDESLVDLTAHEADRLDQAGGIDPRAARRQRARAHQRQRKDGRDGEEA